MRRWAGLLALVAVLGACGDGRAIPAEYLTIEVSAPEEVRVGKGFQLTVTRIWSKDLVPEESGEDALPPLHLEVEETVRRENDTHVEEVRHYQAYCFTTGDLEVHAPSIAASPVLGGAALAVEGNRLSLTVNGTLDPDAPGEAELPEGPLEPSRTWLSLLLAAVGTMAGIYIIRRRRRSAGAAVVEKPEPAASPLWELTLAELKRLRATEPGSPDQIQAYYVEVTAVIRGYLGEQFSFDARERTTEELDLVPDLRECRSGLRDFFTHADLVKFARHEPTLGERDRMMDSAESLVRETGAE